MPFTAFISDLHLSAERPAANDAFFAFLRDIAIQADGLYILGDLFEYWAGDDDLSDAFNASVCNALLVLSRSVPLSIMHGNRDFLLMRPFAEASGARLLHARVLERPIEAHDRRAHAGGNRRKAVRIRWHGFATSATECHQTYVDSVVSVRSPRQGGRYLSVHDPVSGTDDVP